MSSAGGGVNRRLTEVVLWIKSLDAELAVQRHKTTSVELKFDTSASGGHAIPPTVCHKT